MTTKLKTWLKYRDKKSNLLKKKTKKIQLALVTFDNVRQNEPLKGEHVSWDELWQDRPKKGNKSCLCYGHNDVYEKS